MRKLDIGIIISIIGILTGATALIISILGLFYTRRRTHIMEEQLSFIRRETEKKRTFEEISKIVHKNIRTIKKYVDSEYFVFPPIHFSRDEILAYIHDNRLEAFSLRIKPRRLRIDFYDGKQLREREVETVETLVETIKSWIKRFEKENVSYSGGVFYFDCDPNILQNPWIDLGDTFAAIREFYRAHGILKSYSHVIDVFDDSVLDDLNQIIGSITEVILNSLMSEHEIKFRSTDKSEDILARLLDEMVDLESVDRLLRRISDDICGKRLHKVQKEMFSKS